MPIQICCLLFILLSAVTASAGSIVTCYSDGAVIVREVDAIKGIAEVPLAAGLLDNSLKVEPAAGTAILSVDVSPARLDSKSDKELETLTEQRQRMEDRLRALDTREEIFKSAAKSQSAKAPRKTKSNPDPMLTIRQGTDFAIAQLETVYTTRRKTEQEIKKIEARIAAVKKSARTEESHVRISVTPARGRAIVSYATSERGWQPYYDMHLAGNGSARFILSARIVGSFAGYLLKVSQGSLLESASAPVIPAKQGNSPVLASYNLPVSEELYGDGIFNSFSGRITNTSAQYLPPGEARLYKNGAYLGRVRFEGLSSGRSRVVSLGSR